VAVALHLPPRKQLYPAIPPSERCGQCKPCLNPRLKKACREARRRQLEAGLAPLEVEQACVAGSSAVPRAAIGSSGGRRLAGEAALAAAVATGRQLGASLLGCRLRIYWPAMRRWYEGVISGFEESTG
jgi:hypothetical protein